MNNGWNLLCRTGSVPLRSEQEMAVHEQFEQLCALAAAGEIDGQDAALLAGHLEECGACRSLLEDFGEIHAQWLPVHPAFASLPDSRSGGRFRQAILRRARQEGAHFSEGAMAGTETKAKPLGNFYFRFSAVSALVLLAALLISVVRFKAAWTTANGSVSLTPAQPAAAKAGASNHGHEELSQAQEEVAKADLLLNSSRVEAERLRKQLQEAQRALREITEDNSAAENRVAELEKQLESARMDLAQRESEVEKAKVNASTSDAVAMAEQREIERLHSEAAAKTASLEREREMLSAGREIRDLIAARNLHIIDVYDTNAEGKTSKAFGRVFYTEGKSLVFYAYDLAPHHAATAKFGFYLWGKRDEAPQYVKVLGELNKDDQQQKRWALTITDPNILAEIDSVFVTLEPAGNGAGKPTGKPLLSAFLGIPANHP